MRGSPIRFVDFTGGLNVKAAPYLIAENQCRDCMNVVSTVRGSIKKRFGCPTHAAPFPASPSMITSLYGVNVGTNSLIATGGSKIYSVSIGGVIQDISGASTFTNNGFWSFVTGPVSGGQGPVFGMNGVDAPIYWPGVGGVANWTASVGSIPNGKYTEYAANRIWVAGTASNPSRLYFSDIGDPRSWTPTNVVDLDPNDGQQITGIQRIGSNLLVFKQNKIFLIYDLDTGANRPISTNVGCVAPRSIASTGDRVFFLSEDQGIFLTNGSKFERISDDISSLFLELTDGVKPLAAGVFFNDNYYLSCAYENSTTNSMTIHYDTQIKSWWKHSNAANQFCVWRPTLTSNAILFAANAKTPEIQKCYQDGIFRDSGQNYTSTWTSPWLAFKEPYRHKRVRQIHIEGRGKVNVYSGQNFIESLSLLRTDAFAQVSTGGHLFGDTAIFGGGDVFGDQFQQGEVRIYSLGVARSFSVEFESVDDNDVEIDAYTWMITPRAN